MTFCYQASVDLADPRNGLGTISVATAGKTTISVNISTFTANPIDGVIPVTMFNHNYVGLGSCVGEDRAATQSLRRSFSSLSLAARVQSKLRSVAVAEGWSTDAESLGFGFNPSTLIYDIDYTANITVTFGNAETARLFGFSELVHTGALQYLSDIVPWGIIRPVLSAVSSPTPNFEPEGIASQAMSAAASVSGITRSVAPIYRDWTQQYETKEKTLRLAADDEHPFTHQELFELCRTNIPFVVVDGFGDGLDEVFYFRGDGSNWRCERASDGNDAQFHISYKAVVAGYLPEG